MESNTPKEIKATTVYPPTNPTSMADVFKGYREEINKWYGVDPNRITRARFATDKKD